MNREIPASERSEVESPTVSRVGEYVASAPRDSLFADSKLIVNNKTGKKAILFININACLSMFIWQRLLLAKEIRFFLLRSIR